MKYAEKNAISKQFESENFLLKEERMLKQSKTAGFTLLHGTSPLILFDSYSRNAITFPFLIEGTFCWLKSSVPGRLTCCRKRARNRGNDSVITLKTCTMAKKGLGDVHLDNPHIPCTRQQKKPVLFEQKSDQFQGYLLQLMKRARRKPSKVEIPYTPCKTNTCMPPIFVRPRRRKTNWKHLINYSHQYFFLSSKSEALKQEIWLVHSWEPRKARLLQAVSLGPWVQSINKEIQNSQLPEPGASTTAPPVLALWSQLWRTSPLD